MAIYLGNSHDALFQVCIPSSTRVICGGFFVRGGEERGVFVIGGEEMSRGRAGLLVCPIF